MSFTSFLASSSFSCLISVARTSSTVLNRSGKSGHPCLVPGFRGKAQSFSALSMILAVGLSCCCCCFVSKSCPVLCDLMDYSLPGKNTGVGWHFLLHGIFPNQGSNPCLLHCWQILYRWATREAPFIQYILPKSLLPASPMAGTGIPRKTRYGSCHARTEYSSVRGWVSGQAPPGRISGGSGTLASAWHSVWAQIFVEEMLNKWLGNTQEGHLTQAQQW